MDVGLVCDACDGFSAMGAQACSKCGAALMLGGAADADDSARDADAEGEACGSCGATVPAGHGFCGRCGAPAGKPSSTGQVKAANEPRKVQTMFFGAMQQARAKLVLIKGDGLDGVSFTLAGQEHVAGRVDAPLLFDEDPYLSPTHANFIYISGKLVVRDESSANGVFIRIRGSAAVQPGDRFLVGEQVLDIEETISNDEPPEALPDGTFFFASPRRGSHFRLVQRLRGGDTGLAYRAQSDIVSLGREGNDINFPEDPFISGRHAQVSYRDGQLTLTDSTSKNGTFLRVNGQQELQHGDYVFMGQPLLRVEIV
jgi:pSer/pThr/pTyr-binding forkhead associated (FHA) protein